MFWRSNDTWIYLAFRFTLLLSLPAFSPHDFKGDSHCSEAPTIGSFKLIPNYRYLSALRALLPHETHSRFRLDSQDPMIIELQAISDRLKTEYLQGHCPD